VNSLDNLYVFVEKGTKDNHVIEFNDAADEYINIRAGKVLVKVEEIPHPTFVRKGNDLKLTVEITLKEALLGFVKEINHLDGHEVELDRFGKVTKPGFL
jgi:DnaJ family protein B protein 11